MNIKVLIIIFSLFLYSCGKDTYKTVSNSNDSSNNPAPPSTTPPTSGSSSFKVEQCGNLVYEQGPFGGSTGVFLRTNNNKYTLIVENNQAQSTLNSLRLPKSVCLYSTKDVGMGYEGDVLYVHAVKVN